VKSLKFSFVLFPELIHNWHLTHTSSRRHRKTEAEEDAELILNDESITEEQKVFTNSPTCTCFE
jgi:hypothetical protein